MGFAGEGERERERERERDVCAPVFVCEGYKVRDKQRETEKFERQKEGESEGERVRWVSVSEGHKDRGRESEPLRTLWIVRCASCLQHARRTKTGR